MKLEDLIVNNSPKTPDLQIDSEPQKTDLIEITPQILGYPDLETQQKAYQTAMKYCLSLSPVSIADVGCGTGDFFHYLQNLQIPVNYTGFEQNQILVKSSNIQLLNVKFEPSFSKDYDWIFYINTFDNLYSSSDEILNFIISSLEEVKIGINIVTFNSTLLEIEPVFNSKELISLLIENNINFLFEQTELFYKILITK